MFYNYLTLPILILTLVNFYTHDTGPEPEVTIRGVKQRGIRVTLVAECTFIVLESHLSVLDQTRRALFYVLENMPVEVSEELRDGDTDLWPNPKHMQTGNKQQTADYFNMNRFIKNTLCNPFNNNII